MERDDWIEEAERLAAELAPHQAAEANANRIDVPPMVRDTDDPADQATTPIDVRPLWVALGIGPTVAVTDPGHVPAVAEPATP
jgi:predicted flap endonuclease-1-like 5' DNA nuclease